MSERHGHGAYCDGEMHDYVVYDLSVRAYRARLRCRCGVLSRTGTRSYERVADAEAAARVLLSRVLSQPLVSSRRRSEASQVKMVPGKFTAQSMPRRS